MPIRPLLSLRLRFAPLLASNPGDATVCVHRISSSLFNINVKKIKIVISVTNKISNLWQRIYNGEYAE